MKRILAVIPMYANGGIRDENERHGKPVAYEVHDVTTTPITQFPDIIDTDGTRRRSLESEVTFKTEAKAQAWIDTQMERENANV